MDERGYYTKKLNYMETCKAAYKIFSPCEVHCDEGKVRMTACSARSKENVRARGGITLPGPWSGCFDNSLSGAGEIILGADDAQLEKPGSLIHQGF